LSTRRRSADDVVRPSASALDSRRQLERVAPGEEPPRTKSPLSLPTAPAIIPSAFWMEDKSPSKPQPHRGAMRTEYSATSVPTLRRKVPACSGSSATTGSTRATPQGSRPGTEASTRASSRFTSASQSRPRIPSVGPQWAAEPEGLLTAGSSGPADAVTASPRGGPPVVLPGDAHRQHCWLGPEDLHDFINKSNRNANNDHSQLDRNPQSHRSLREAAATSHPGLPPDLTAELRPESHSLASLDDVLREMKAMIRNAPDGIGDATREEITVKAQERARQAATASKTASSTSKTGVRSSSRPSTGLRGHRAAAVGRGADTATDDRSPSSQRASHRRQAPLRSDRSENRGIGRQRSHDELDFAVSEPFNILEHGTHNTPPRGGHGGEAAAPAAPWAESRKPLQALEPEDANSPDRGPPMPWAQGTSARLLQDGDQDWKSLQSNWNSAMVNGVGQKPVQSTGCQQRHLSRSGSSVKRAPTSENNISGLGFIF